MEVYLKIDIDLWDCFIVKKSNVNLLSENIFLTSESNWDVNKKYKIIDNSLWRTWEFNPMIFKNKLRKEIFSCDFNKSLENINNEFDSKIIEKAINYLYTKETKGSLEIEGEKFHQSKNRWFLKLISNIPIKGELRWDDLVNYYNTIYSDNLSSYRNSQNYIWSWNWMMWENIIDYIPPKSEDVEKLMEALLYFYNKNKDSLNYLVLASILSTQFVLIHPFLDWNGRTSRFLLQYSLLNSWVWVIWDNKIILPVSAYIALNKDVYYKQLEEISGVLLDFIDYDEKNDGDIEVLNDTSMVYRNLDFTDILNYFYGVLEDSINIDYKRELEYIYRFHKVYTLIDSSYNISSNNVSFITKNLIENNWELSKNKFKILEKRWVSRDILEEINKLFSKCLV